MVQRRGANIILVWKSEGKRQFEGPPLDGVCVVCLVCVVCVGVCNIKIYFREIRRGDGLD
jgi:hypothetical protein